MKLFDNNLIPDVTKSCDNRLFDYESTDQQNHTNQTEISNESISESLVNSINYLVNTNHNEINSENDSDQISNVQIYSNSLNYNISNDTK